MASFASVLCLSVGIAVGGMLVWHLFLIATQQTTIEFYTNQLVKRQAKRHNIVSSSVTFVTKINLLFLSSNQIV
jgi:ABC-type nickel/cobalt efflux system permease component RcnA